MSDLSGLKALVVEDEGAIALLIEDILSDLGLIIAASVARLTDALEIARASALDIAILDVNVAGEPVFPVARVLRDRQIPFAFSTGYGQDGVPSEFSGCPVLSKPFTAERLRLTIERALANRSSAEPIGMTQRHRSG